MKSHRFLIVIEKAKANYSAYSPDLPGCIATGKTKATAERNMRTAIKMHLAGMREDGMLLPRASAAAQYVTVRTA